MSLSNKPIAGKGAPGCCVGVSRPGGQLPPSSPAAATGACGPPPPASGEPPPLPSSWLQPFSWPSPRPDALPWPAKHSPVTQFPWTSIQDCKGWGDPGRSPRFPQGPEEGIRGHLQTRLPNGCSGAWPRGSGWTRPGLRHGRWEELRLGKVPYAPSRSSPRSARTSARSASFSLL